MMIIKNKGYNVFEAHFNLYRDLNENEDIIINEQENSQEEIKDSNEINDDNKSNICQDIQQNDGNENLSEMSVFVKENKFNDNELIDLNDELIDKNDNDNKLELIQNFQQNEIINNLDNEIKNININKKINDEIINIKNSENTINEVFEHFSNFL